MSFFEPPPPPPKPPEVHRQPEWLGPPENELGVALSEQLVLVRRDDLVLAVTELVAYSRGLTVRLTLRRRGEELGYDPFHPYPRSRASGGELAPEQLRFGIELADGGKATNLDGFPYALVDEPAGPVLVMRGGGGGGRSWDLSFWIWPLPPPGPIAFLVEWPAQDVGLMRAELDAGHVLDAAVRSEPLWPDDDPGATGASAT